LSDNFPIQNGLKQGDALLPLLFNFALVATQEEIKIRETSQGTQNIDYW
jgi:hypothetical protein